MNDSKFQDWFYGLPIWAELDNYVYFGLAGLLLWLLPFDDKTMIAIGGALIGAIILKGRGNGGPKG